MAFEDLTSGDANPFDVVRTSDSTYSADYAEFVISDGDEVELPDPSEDDAVMIRDLGSEITITASSGDIDGSEGDMVIVGDEPVLFASDGNDWYSFTDTDLLEAAIPDSVIDRWPIDEESGQTLANSETSNNISLNFENWESGDWIGGWAIDFDGTDDNGDANVDTVAGDMTMVATIEWDSGKDSIETAYAWGRDSAGARKIWANNPSDVIGYSIRNDDGDPFNTEWEPSSDGTYRVAGVLDVSGDNETKLYVNGELKDTTSLSGDFDTTRSDLRVGSSTEDDRYYEGILDEPMLADEAWDLETVEDDYDRQPWS